MKKVLYSLTAFAVFAVLALPAGAGSHKGGFGGFSYDSSIEVTNTNVAMGVGNSSNTSANTGDNEVEDNGGTYQYQESLDKYSKSKSHNYDWWHGWYGSKTYKKSHSHWQMSETYPAGGDVKVKTGDATAYSNNVNVVNTNETLIVRGGLYID